VLLISAFGLLIASPVLLPVMFLVWLEDRHSPFYVAPRVGLGGRPFRMVKMRSMVVNADRQGASSTAATDRRITAVGHFIRRYKIDELTQLWNVLKGDMSLVGPRPQVQSGVDVYTAQERHLLSVKPGITDIASIVFADEGEILRGHSDPDLGYNQLIRPGKSRLGLFYVAHRSTALDMRLIGLTLLGVLARERALAGIQRILRAHGAPPELIELAARRIALTPLPPPGSNRIVASSDGSVSS
jgi:lipopolysaccharide/colanic/teichoic acid biosynthesis glycosyltransferase